MASPRPSARTRDLYNGQTRPVLPGRRDRCHLDTLTPAARRRAEPAARRMR